MSNPKIRIARNNLLRKEMLKLGIDPSKNFTSGVRALALKFEFNLKDIKSNKWNKVVYHLIRGCSHDEALSKSGARRINKVKYAKYRVSCTTNNKPVNAPRLKWNPSLYDADAVVQKPSEQTLKDFYASWEWKRCRYRFLLLKERKCECCSASAADGVCVVVDHIKPIRYNWHLRLDQTNLQVLCNDCNMGKGSWDQTNFTRENVVEFPVNRAKSKIILGKEYD